MQNISASSSWSSDEIDQFLNGSTIPIRLAVQDNDFPLICSVWFSYDPKAEVIYCASHENSYLIKLLTKAGRCGFEIALNDPPYKGVRGKAEVRLLRQDATGLLNTLINRYLGDTSSGLAKWLLGRVNEEVIIEISPRWITAWDYSERMS